MSNFYISKLLEMYAKIYDLMKVNNFSSLEMLFESEIHVQDLLVLAEKSTMEFVEMLLD